MKILYKYRFIIFSLIISILVLYPYFSNTLNYEHDTFFHLSRIEGYANAISRLDFFPSIYPLKNANYGYLSPTFYCDIFLIIPAILYNLNVNIIDCYKILLFIFSLISCLTITKLIKKFSNNDYSVYIGIALYIFATYRLTNIYVRGAIGEVIAYAFIPIVIIGIYELLYENKYKNLVIGYSLVLLSHNITFILLCIILLIFLIINYKLIIKNSSIILNLIKASILSILIVAFFIFPMLEQLSVQDLILENRDNTSSLSGSSLHIYQFLLNRLNFNISEQSFNGMVVNVGILTMLLPLSYLLISNTKLENKFIKHSMIIGYILIIIQTSLIPWEHMSILSFMQFVFRLNNVCIVLLVLPASIYLVNNIFSKKYKHIIIISIIILNGLYLIKDVPNRTNVLTNKHTYNDLIEGKIIDPYYSAYYIRVELAGADYLPKEYFNYKDEKYGIYIKDTNTYSSLPEINYHDMTFKLDNINDVTVRLPKTYYKGYKLYGINNGIETEIEINKSSDSLIEFNVKNHYDSYRLTYSNTLIKTISCLISIITIVILIIYINKNRININKS